jgi:hypothetical protein
MGEQKMKQIEPMLLWENQVPYYRIKYPTLEKAPKGFFPVTYDIHHIPTGKKFKGEVWVSQVGHILKLVNHWNKCNDWKYIA